MWIKICGITRLDDALAAACFGADAVGFVFAESPRRINLEDARHISQRLSGGILKVGVFVNENAETISRIAKECRLDIIQLHGKESSSFLEELKMPAIKAVRVKERIDPLKARAFSCSMVLLDGFYSNGLSGEERRNCLGTAREMVAGKKLVVAGGLKPQNVGEAVKTAKPFGVDVSSGIESSPGVKDVVSMYRFIENARKADYEVRNK